MALTEAEQKHLAMVKARIAELIEENRTRGWWKDLPGAILALTGKDGKRLLRVVHPKQMLPCPKICIYARELPARGWVCVLPFCAGKEVKP